MEDKVIIARKKKLNRTETALKNLDILLCYIDVRNIKFGDYTEILRKLQTEIKDEVINDRNDYFSVKYSQGAKQ